MFLKRHKFVFKIVIMLLCFSLLPMLLINIIWYGISTDLQEKEIIRSSRDMLNQMEGNLDNYKDIFDQNAMTFLYDKDMKYYLSTQKKVSDEEIQMRASFIQNELIEAASYNTMISAIYLIGNNYRESSKQEQQIDYEKLMQETWYKNFVTSGKSWMFTGIHYNSYVEGEKKAVFSCMRRIVGSIGGNTAGIVVYEINYANFKNLFDKLSEDSANRWFVFDKAGNIIYSPAGFIDNVSRDADMNQLIKKTTDGVSRENYQYQGASYMMVSNKIESMNWTIVELIDKNAMLATVNSVVTGVNQAILITVFLLMAVAVLYLYYVIRPLNQIVSYMEEIQNDNFEVRFQKESLDEFGRIKTGFNKMVIHINQLMEDIKKREKEKRNIEIKMLQSQINPHFLYNTLNIIRWHAMIAGNEMVSRMIVTLIKTMEFNGKRKEEFVTIGDELDHIKNYIQLLKYHYEDRFEVIYEIDDKVYPCYTFKLLLQPLIENAVFHGIVPGEKKGILQIQIQYDESRIYCAVQDNGVGMDEEALQTVFDGIGLSNVKERLKYYYGEAYSLHVASDRKRGTRISFSIPVIRSLPYYKSVSYEGIPHEEENPC
ncbi:MAG: sensor histidine kinase [Lachnospiraceae bacterium]|nr:sensor histidine kinase [Lachnospiraceae bacterium]